MTNKTITTQELLEYVKQVSKDHDEGKRDNAVVDAKLINGGIVGVNIYLEWYESRLRCEEFLGDKYRTSLRKFQERFPDKQWVIYESD